MHEILAFDPGNETNPTAGRQRLSMYVSALMHDERVNKVGVTLMEGNKGWTCQMRCEVHVIFLLHICDMERVTLL